MVPSSSNIRLGDSPKESSPNRRNISLRTRGIMQPQRSSPIRRSETDNDFALAMCRENRRVSPGRLHTDSELAGNQATAIMTSVSSCV